VNLQCLQAADCSLCHLDAYLRCVSSLRVSPQFISVTCCSHRVTCRLASSSPAYVWLTAVAIGSWSAWYPLPPDIWSIILDGWDWLYLELLHITEEASDHLVDGLLAVYTTLQQLAADCLGGNSCCVRIRLLPYLKCYLHWVCFAYSGARYRSTNQEIPAIGITLCCILLYSVYRWHTTLAHCLMYSLELWSEPKDFDFS